MSITIDRNLSNSMPNENISAESIRLPLDVVEYLCSQSKNSTGHTQRQRLGNPAPVGLGGFLLCATPVSLSLLELQGVGGFAAAANIGAYLGLGSVMLILGGIGEWVLGNTFSSVVFCLFGGYWLTLGITIIPGSGAYGIYSTTESAVDVLDNPQFYATFSFILVAMTILCALLTVASIRTNIVWFFMFVLLTTYFGCLAGSFFTFMEKPSSALLLQKVGAGFLFAATILGWYMWFALILLSVNFPISLPVGELSSIVPGRNNQAEMKNTKDA
ncbi:hypothetical protein FPRO06_00087 [Fusarium proliferatum]|nr:hypothetical protein FPRO06_00087 [Fusarium proliferatum]